MQLFRFPVGPHLLQSKMLPLEQVGLRLCRPRVLLGAETTDTTGFRTRSAPKVSQVGNTVKKCIVPVFFVTCLLQAQLPLMVVYGIAVYSCLLLLPTSCKNSTFTGFVSDMFIILLVHIALFSSCFAKWTKYIGPAIFVTFDWAPAHLMKCRALASSES